MTIELRPLGVLCNLQCRYCYQHPQRQAGNLSRLYDLEAMKRAAAEENGHFTLFGGEPLLLPLRDLEALWAWGLERYEKNSVQTNGTLIRDAHIALFRKYKVQVGISIDGPGERNDLRWVGSLEATRAATARTEAAIERLCREDLDPSVIVTLHSLNCRNGGLEEMNEWLRGLEAMGVRSARLHLLESESAAIREAYGLTTEESVAALRNFAALETTLAKLRFDLFREMEKLLLGDDDGVSCLWAACDPYTTRAVRGIEGHGQRSNCGRTDKEGIPFVKVSQPRYERQLALYHTEQRWGGCAGCRFFLMCKGQCPGTAIDGDWRNRSEHCEVWRSLFETLEARLMAEGKNPLSAQPEREKIEAEIVSAWARGSNPSLKSLMEKK